MRTFIDPILKIKIEMLSCSNIGDIYAPFRYLHKTHKPLSGFRITALKGMRSMKHSDRQVVANNPENKKRLTHRMRQLIMTKDCFTDTRGRCVSIAFAGLHVCRLQDSRGNNELVTYEKLMDLIG